VRLLATYAACLVSGLGIGWSVHHPDSGRKPSCPATAAIVGGAAGAEAGQAVAR